MKNDISWSEIGSGFWRAWRHAPTKNSQEYPPPPPPRLLLAIVPFHLVLLFFRDPFSALLDYPSRDSALTQFIIHASSDAPRTSKVLMNELLYMLKLLSFSITCRRWSTAFFCNTESPENRAVVARCTRLTPLTSSNEVISMVSDHSTFILVFHIVMISEGTEVRHRLNADFSCTEFIATAVAICPVA